jgi:hypothetical protein
MSGSKSGGIDFSRVQRLYDMFMKLEVQDRREICLQNMIRLWVLKHFCFDIDNYNLYRSNIEEVIDALSVEKAVSKESDYDYIAIMNTFWENIEDHKTIIDKLKLPDKGICNIRQYVSQTNSIMCIIMVDFYSADASIFDLRINQFARALEKYKNIFGRIDMIWAKFEREQDFREAYKLSKRDIKVMASKKLSNGKGKEPMEFHVSPSVEGVFHEENRRGDDYKNPYIVSFMQ